MKFDTIGFTKKAAQEFFGHSRKAGVAWIVHVRLNNASQLADLTEPQARGGRSSDVPVSS